MFNYFTASVIIQIKILKFDTTSSKLTKISAPLKILFNLLEGSNLKFNVYFCVNDTGI